MPPRFAPVSPELHAAIGHELAEPNRPVRNYVTQRLEVGVVALTLSYTSYGPGIGQPFETLLFAEVTNPEWEEWYARQPSIAENVARSFSGVVPALTESDDPPPPSVLWTVVHRSEHRMWPHDELAIDGRVVAP